MDPIARVRPCRRPAHPPGGAEDRRRGGSRGDCTADRVGADDRRDRSSASYPFYARRRVGRSAAGRRRSLDAARAGSAQRRRHADDQRRGPVGGRRRSEVRQRSSSTVRSSRVRSSATACTSRSSGSKPWREYWYRFRVGDEVSQTGRTRTAPAAGANPIDCASRVCGCSHYESRLLHRATGGSPTNTSTSSSTRGDYIYEGRADGGRNPNAVVRQHHGTEIYSIVDYRNRYALYKSDPDLMAAHASAPFLVTYRRSRSRQRLRRRPGRAGHSAGAVPATSSRRVPGVLRDDAAAARRRLPTGSSMRLYPAIAVRQADRPQRARHAAVPLEAGVRRRVEARRVAEALDPKRTILGAEQEKWLFENLSAAQSTWTVLAQQVPTFARDLRAVEPGRPLLDGQVGRVRGRRAVGCTRG